MSLHARAWCQCYRVSVDAGGAACVCVCAVSERLRGVDYVGWQGAVLDVSFRPSESLDETGCIDVS